VEVFDETGLSDLAVVFGVLIDIGEGLASSGVDIGAGTFVEDAHYLFLRQAGLGYLVEDQFDLFLREGLLRTLGRLLLEVLLLLGFEVVNVAHSSEYQFGDIVDDAPFAPRLDPDAGPHELPQHHSQHNMLDNSKHPFLHKPVLDLFE
jgi:hypothetical protein